jgi:hypothetical protein
MQKGNRNGRDDGSRRLEAALSYLERGWSVIAASRETKKPPIPWKEFQERRPTEDEVRGWFDQWPTANVAIVTGEISGVVAIDVDGPAGEAALRAAGIELPRSPTSITARGLHVLHAHPGFRVKTTAKLMGMEKVDLRGDGGYIIGAPSVHATGHVYRWQDALGPDTPLASLPAGVLDALRPSNGTVSAAALEPSTSIICEGGRNDALVRYVGSLFGAGKSDAEVVELALQYNRERFSSPLPLDELLRTVSSIGNREKRKVSKATSTRRSVAGAPRLRTRRLSSVAAEQAEWQWEGYVPLGTLTMLEGDPGVGKSHVSLDLAARTSTGGAMPDGTPGRVGGVILLAAEDSAGATIRPRLEAMGADLERVTIIDSVELPDGGTRGFRLPDDVALLADFARDMDARLVVIDPLASHLSPDVNYWSDPDVRRALMPLLDLARDSRFAVVAVRHPKKNREVDALFAGNGSIGITALARVALYVGEDPDDDSRRVLAPFKNNLSAKRVSLGFHLEAADSGSARVVWTGVSPHAADALRGSKRERQSRLDEASEFVREFLSDGPRSANDVRAEAVKRGLKWRTVERAAEKHGYSKKEGFGPGSEWKWRLPATENLAVFDASPPTMVRKGEETKTANLLAPLSEAEAERAAILEFEAGLTSDEAERLAATQTEEGSAP